MAMYTTEHASARQYKFYSYSIKQIMFIYKKADLENCQQNIYKFNGILNMCQYILFQFFDYARAFHEK